MSLSVSHTVVRVQLPVGRGLKEDMGVSDETIKDYVTSIFKKQCHTRPLQSHVRLSVITNDNACKYKSTGFLQRKKIDIRLFLALLPEAESDFFRFSWGCFSGKVDNVYETINSGVVTSKVKFG